MPRPPRTASGDSDPRDGGAAVPARRRARLPEASTPPGPSLAGLGIAGVSRRRLAWAGLAVLAAWIVVGFAGQAAESAKAADLLAEQRASYEQAALETEALRRELQLVVQERWILQQARAYQLGSRKERPFALAADAPALPDDAPGSAAVRLGGAPAEPSSLEAWLEVLFGARP
jgi:hypothetical protein